MHRYKQRASTCVAHLAALFRRSASDLALDLIERVDALDSFRRNGRLMCLYQVVELAPDVRHAWRFLESTTFVELVEASIMWCTT
jgi:hypothetical protein